MAVQAQSKSDAKSKSPKSDKPPKGDKPTVKTDGAAKSAKPGKDDLAPFPSGPNEAKFKEKVGGDFKVRHTDHFFVLYNSEDEVVKDFILRIEATYKAVHRFAITCEITIDYPREKLPVVFCREFEEYSDVALKIGGAPAPREAAGLYFPEANFSLFYDMANSESVKENMAKVIALKNEAKNAGSAAAGKAKADEARFIQNRMDQHQEKSNRSVVRHEVAHQLLHNFHVHKRDVHNPVWFVEGMATLFEYEPGRGRSESAGFNAINQYRLWRLRDADKESPLPELSELIKNPALLRGDGETMDRGYAQSWGLTYFLAQKKKKQLREYIELVKTRKKREEITPEREMEDFQKCFGRVDESFKSQWQKFVKDLPYRAPS